MTVIVSGFDDLALQSELHFITGSNYDELHSVRIVSYYSINHES